MCSGIPDTITLTDSATTSGQSISDRGSSVNDEEYSNPSGSSADHFSLVSGISEVLNLLKILGDGHRHLLMYNCQVLYEYNVRMGFIFFDLISLLKVKLLMLKPRMTKLDTTAGSFVGI